MESCARAVIAACILTAICGCGSLRQWAGNGFKVGPNYQKPAAPVASEWIDLERDDRISGDAPDLAAWWKTFNDPVLDELIATTYEQNLTLREAGTRILQAQAVRRISAGNLFPQFQQAFGSYNRVQISSQTANSAPVKHFDQWDTGFNLSWEIDFWGRFRRAVESSDAALDASIEGYDNVLVLLVSDVASSYVQIRTLQEELRLLRENVRLQKESLAIADTQFQAGAADQSDVLQTRNNVEQTEAIIPALEAALRQANNALCVLLGIPPRDLIAELGAGPIPAAPPQIAVGIPADLLRRRPDIRQAERIVAAQCAKIGVAESELYPHFAINGVLDWQAKNLSDLFAPGSTAGAVGPSFAWNILNYGRIANSIRQQDAVFQQAVYSYQDTVLEAQRETENAIVGFLKSRDQAEKLRLAVKDITQLNELLMVQAKAGGRDFNRVFVVQAQMTVQQDNLATSQGNVTLNLIRIYRALGGGWQIRLSPADHPNSASVAPHDHLGPRVPPTEELPAPQPQDQPAN